MQLTDTARLTQTLAEFAATAEPEDVSAGARASARRSLLHITTGMVAGYSRGLGHGKLSEMMLATGGLEQATIIGSGKRVPAAHAAMVNGSTARALNLDDHFDDAIVHPSGSVIPAAIAAGELSGNVSGEALAAAVAIGNEVVCRLASSITTPGNEGRQQSGWFQASVFGIFGATVAASRLMRLDPGATQSALGIALFSAAGTLEAFAPSAQTRMMRGMVTGFAAQAAVNATQMAAAGITGVPEPLEGPWGFFSSYFGGRYDPVQVTSGLGARWLSEKIAIKPFPACRWTHSYIDAMIQLMKRDAVSVDDIEQIRLHLSGFVSTRCDPIDRQRRPENFNHAGHALPFLVAAAARRGRVTIADLLDVRCDSDTRALAERVIPVHDLRYGYDDGVGPAYVEITRRDGSVTGFENQHAPGSLGNPLSNDDRIACARHNLVLAGMTDDDLDSLIVRLDAIDQEPDVGQLIQELRGLGLDQ